MEWLDKHIIFFVGQKFAMQEMKTLMVALLKQFQILPEIDPKTIVFQTGLTLRTKNQIHVKLVRRKWGSFNGMELFTELC